MKLEGMHHITTITGDARQNVEFYADVLGLRLVKKTVNFDAPDAYHLYFGDEDQRALGDAWEKVLLPSEHLRLPA